MKTQSIKFKKMRLLALLSTVFGLMSLETYAQEVFGIKGTVTDTTGALIESGSVILLSPNDSTVLKGTHFWDGKFELLGVESTDVILKVEAFEYAPYYERKTLTPDTNGMVDLGQITLKTMTQSLDEVNIVYRIPMFEREVGKLVVNVEGTILSDKGTLLDVLKSAPNIIL